MSDEQEIREVIDEAKEPKSFNIINVLQERAYPKTSVEVVLDEENSYRASMVKEKIEAIEKKVGTKNASASQKETIDKLTAELEELLEKLSESKYVFHIRGISEGKREKLIADATKKYPVEYEKGAELSALLGSGGEPREKPSPERDQLFTDFLWQHQIEKIVDPDGNEQTGLGYSDIRALRDNLPLSSAAKINRSIEKIRSATALFMMETGEDFLAKP
jgi:predicted RNA-binding protein YlxR (DUF448 family)